MTAEAAAPAELVEFLAAADVPVEPAVLVQESLWLAANSVAVKTVVEWADACVAVAEAWLAAEAD